MLRRVVSENEIISRRRPTRGGLTVTPRLDVPLRSSRQQPHLLIMQPEAVYTRNTESMASPTYRTALLIYMFLIHYANSYSCLVTVCQSHYYQSFWLSHR